MAVSPLPTPDDRTVASTPTPEAKPTPDLVLVTENDPQGDDQAPAQPGEPSNPEQDAPQTPAEANTPNLSQRTPLTAVPTGPEAFTRSADATEPGGMYDAVTRPRLAAVRNADEHYVPAIARYANELTEGALALRHQAIIRLGVTSTPDNLTPPTPSGAAHADTAQLCAMQTDSSQAHTAGADAALATTTQIGAAQARPSHADASQGDVADTGRVHVGAALAETAQARTTDANAEHAPTTHPAADGDGRSAGRVARDGGSAARVARDGGSAVRVGGGGGVVVRGGAAARGALADEAGTGSAAVRGSGLGSVSGRVVGGAGREGLPGLPDARMWGGRLAQAVSEVLAGDRPISQLVRFTDDQVFLELNRRVRLLGLNSTAGVRGAKEKSSVRSVRVFMPQPSIAEVAAHVRHGERSRAVALRLEIRRNRWVCTALQLD